MRCTYCKNPANISLCARCQKRTNDELAKQQWQEIDTAPYGITILVYDKCMGVCIASKMQEKESKKDVIVAGRVCLSYCEWWMPLPRPPEERNIDGKPK